MSNSALRPFLTQLHDVYRHASHGDLNVTPEEVQLLLAVFVAMWASAKTRIQAGTSPSHLDAIATELQPAGRNDLRDPLNAARAMHVDMQVFIDAWARRVSVSMLDSGITDLHGDDAKAYADVRHRYGNLAGCAHGIMRALALMMDKYNEGDLDVVLAPFLPQLATAIIAPRPARQPL